MKITPEKFACTEPQYGGLAVFDAIAMINWDTCGYFNYNNDRNSILESQNAFAKKQINKEQLIKLFPNPTASNITIELFENFQFDNLQISNISGVIIKCDIKLFENKIVIETLNLPKGFYILKITDKVKNVYNKSFIKL